MPPASNKRATELWLVALLCALPVIASYLAFYLWPPQRQTNYGELLEPRALADMALQRTDGAPFRMAELKGKWIMLSIDSGACDAYCKDKLWKLRQVRLAQGKDRERIERVWVIDDAAAPAADLTVEYQGTRLVGARRDDAFVRQFPAQHDAHDHIYLIDPLGNLMLRYPRDADAMRIIKDLSRLLKVSTVG